MASRRRTQDGEIRARLPHALRDVGEYALGRNGEVRDCFSHPRLGVVAHPHDLGVRMLIRLAQKVTHVDVFEAQADDPPFPHLKLLPKKRGLPAYRSSSGSRSCGLFIAKPLS